MSLLRNKKILVTVVAGTLTLGSLSFAIFANTSSVDKAELRRKYDAALERATILSYQVETKEGRAQHIKSEEDFQQKAQELMASTIEVTKYAKELGIENIGPKAEAKNGVTEKEKVLKRLKGIQEVCEEDIRVGLNTKEILDLSQRKVKYAKQLQDDLLNDRIPVEQANKEIEKFKTNDIP